MCKYGKISRRYLFPKPPFSLFVGYPPPPSVERKIVSEIESRVRCLKCYMHVYKVVLDVERE